MHPHVCVFFLSLWCLWHCKQLPQVHSSPSSSCRQAGDWQIGSVCCSSAYGRRSSPMWLPASAVRDDSLLWGKRALNGEGGWHKKRLLLHLLPFQLNSSPLLSFALFFVVVCSSLWILLLIKSVPLTATLIKEANFVLISHVNCHNVLIFPLFGTRLMKSIRLRWLSSIVVYLPRPRLFSCQMASRSRWHTTRKYHILLLGHPL